MSKAAHVLVEKDGKYFSEERMIKRFLKMCKRERIKELYKEKTGFFQTRNQKKRAKRSRARARWFRELEKSNAPQTSRFNRTRV